MAHRAAIIQRRSKVRRLYIMGFSPTETKNSLDNKYSLSTINRDIKQIENERVDWFSKNSKLKDRLPHYFKERLDNSDEIKREAWTIYHDSNSSAKIKLGALHVVLSAETHLSELLGFTGGQSVINTLEVHERLDELEKQLSEIREIAKHAASNNIKT